MFVSVNYWEIPSQSVNSFDFFNMIPLSSQSKHFDSNVTLQEFWWAVLLMGISFVIFMAIFIRCCAIHTPSSNPNLPKNLQFSETLRRPVRSLQKQVCTLDTKQREHVHCINGDFNSIDLICGHPIKLYLN